MRKSVGLIPKYITSVTPEGLRRNMLRVQLALGYGVEFFDIQHQTQIKNNKQKITWFAWYYDAATITSNNVGEQLDTGNGNGNGEG